MSINILPCIQANALLIMNHSPVIRLTGSQLAVTVSADLKSFDKNGFMHIDEFLIGPYCRLTRQYLGDTYKTLGDLKSFSLS